MAPTKRQKPMAKHSIFPVNQFPREILAEISWNCLPGKSSEVQILKRAAPLLVSSICSSWRELALATPKLWTTVSITLVGPGTMDPSATASATYVINAWLERSGNLPLKLYLAQLSNTDPALFQSILSAFYSHSSRWQDVSLLLYQTRSLLLPQLDAPLLRSFYLPGPRQETSNFPFRNSSRLTELSWPSPIDVSKNPQIPWAFRMECPFFPYRKLSTCVSN